MRRRYDLYLRDILTAVDRIEVYVAGLDAEMLKHDYMRFDAVSRELEIIGEAARQLPEEIRQRYQDIPWRWIIGFRNVVSHQYWRVDIDVVWGIVQRQLPKLRVQIRDVLRAEKNRRKAA